MSTAIREPPRSFSGIGLPGHGLLRRAVRSHSARPRKARRLHVGSLPLEPGLVLVVTLSVSRHGVARVDAQLQSPRALHARAQRRRTVPARFLKP